MQTPSERLEAITEAVRTLGMNTAFGSGIDNPLAAGDPDLWGRVGITSIDTFERLLEATDDETPYSEACPSSLWKWKNWFVYRDVEFYCYSAEPLSPVRPAPKE